MGVKESIIKHQKEVINADLNPNYGNGFYLNKVEKNLISDMAKEHAKQFGEGLGGELAPENPKMSALRSSSAMTYNLLGNYAIRMIPNKYCFTPGDYKVEYEKQICTLGCDGNPANLDAFLSYQSKDNKGEAIFCEMKMLEWLSTGHDTISSKYKQGKNYFSMEGYTVFLKIILELEKVEFKRYDAWQMFKHTLAIYNATFKGYADMNIEKYNSKVKILDLVGCFTRIKLANVVYQIYDGQFDDLRTWHSYERMVIEENEEFKAFKSVMLDEKNGLKELFKEKCGVDFDIIFISTYDFIQCMSKTEDELNFLRRYWVV